MPNSLSGSTISQGVCAMIVQGSPTSTVSTSMIFSAIGIKFVLVEFLELAM